MLAIFFNMEQDRQQERGRNQRAQEQRAHQRGQRGGHGPHQRGQIGGHRAPSNKKEVGMGPVKEVDIREREADSRELLCLMIVVDHVVNRRLTMAETARLVQPNLKRSTVNSIMRTFRQENW